MYFPNDLPHVFCGVGPDAPEDILSVIHSSDGEYLAVCCPRSIHLWKVFPFIHLHTYQRTELSYQEHGTNTLILWRLERPTLAVALSRGYIQLLNVNGDDASPPDLYNLDFTRHGPSSGISLVSHVPHHTFVLVPAAADSPVIPVTSTITSMTNGRGAILVASILGIIERVPWDNPFLENALALSS